MSFLVVENLDDSDQFIFVWKFDMIIEQYNELKRIRNPEKKTLQHGQAGLAICRIKNLNSLSDSKQVCLVPNAKQSDLT